MKKSLIALTIASAITPTLAYANSTDDNTLSKDSANVEVTNPKELETLLVTANRIQQNKADLLSSVKVITRSDIELSAANSVADLLSEVNGLQISKSGGAGQNTSLFSRGTNSGHILVVIDGQRISSATLGQIEFANLATEQIERIEVIKGPRAALWGSDAIGGVIQIFTRQLSPNEIAVDLGLGSDQLQQASFSAGIAHGNGNTTLTASVKSSDGYDILDLAEPDNDGYNRENISIVGQQNLNEQWQVNWLAKYNQGETEYDNAYGGADESSFEAHQWQLSANQTTGNWQQQFIIGQQENKNINFGKNVSEQDGSYFETKRLQGTWLGSYQLSHLLNSSFGIDLINEKVNAITDYDNNERDIQSAFTRLAFDNERIILDAALRYDDIEGINSEVTYNASVGFRFAQDSLISLNLGSGFKAPSFNDLYYPEDAYSYGNPDLVAETSDSIELLIKTSVQQVDAELSIYHTEIDNLIEWQPDENFAYHPVNLNQAKIQGIELALAAQLLGLDHQLQLNYLDATDHKTDEQLIRRAKHTASYQVSHRWEKLNLLASVNYQGEREDSEWPGTITLPSHTLVNLSAQYQVANAWVLGLKINNLFDKDYVTNNHYVGQPAQYLFTVSYRR